MKHLMLYGPGILLLLSLSFYAGAQPADRLIRKGNKEYRDNRFKEALPLYQQAQQLRGNNAAAWFNAGDALYRNKQWAEAERSFDRVTEPHNDPLLQQKAFYNKGVSLSRQNKLEESIAAYKKAVIMDPADEDARINLQKALLEWKQKNPPEPEKTKEEQPRQDKKKERAPPSQSKLTPKQAEQLLKALQQREQQAMQKMQQLRSRSSGQPEKDW
ncbi:MAG TPA: tetratricopeptide repeat protein [Flavitalea sp.]|nr:tetratricopeptide repeat protein [Flavitalea sp.]